MGKKIDFKRWGCCKREKEEYKLGEKDNRRWYQRDIDQITHSTGFRKLQRKSQLLSEKDPRSRSRLIHTIEVSRIATEISEELGISKELTEAISFAHDIGTSPYGYVGNSFLSNKVGDSFSHEVVGGMMLQWIAKKETTSEDQRATIENIIDNHSGDMNNCYLRVASSPFPLLVSRSIISGKKTPARKYYIHHISPEIIDGVINHGANGTPGTLEGQVVKFADNIAYLSQDIEDLLSAKMIDTEEFTKFAAKDKLLFIKKNADGSTHEEQMSWNEIDKDASLPSLKMAFNQVRGRRISAFINRFVEYNKKLLLISNDNFSFAHSSVLDTDIPLLKCDEGMQFVIDFMWAFIESNYSKTLIKTSNALQVTKMEQLWEILQSKAFTDPQNCFGSFMQTISDNTIFNKFTDDWKRAFFISNLSWQEVDYIIESFHERNYAIELDLDFI